MEPRQAGPSISIHALLAESDVLFCAPSVQPDHFYPRSPCGERHTQMQAAFKGPEISIHALLAESDQGKLLPDGILKFLSTLSLRRATLAYPDMIICTNVISIHALLAESDA